MTTFYVSDAPICSSQFMRRNMAALRHETIRIRCEVRADPSLVRFRWTFNSSSDVLPIPPTRILTPNSTQPTSYIDFTPATDEDFGTLACWASNSIGFQAEPCMTNIVPARKLKLGIENKMEQENKFNLNLVKTRKWYTK